MDVAVGNGRNDSGGATSQRAEEGTAAACRSGGRLRVAGGDPLALVSVVLALAAAWSFAFVPLRASQDEWWHLKTGRWIVEHGGLPTTDIFTYAGEGLRWHNHEWLAQVIFYGVYAAGDRTAWGGLRALITFKALVVVATFGLVMWCAARRCGSWRVAALVGLVAADVARRTIYPPADPVLSADGGLRGAAVGVEAGPAEAGMAVGTAGSYAGVGEPARDGAAGAGGGGGVCWWRAVGGGGAVGAGAAAGGRVAAGAGGGTADAGLPGAVRVAGDRRPGGRRGSDG
jgi:hypothetical protein